MINNTRSGNTWLYFENEPNVFSDGLDDVSEDEKRSQRWLNFFLLEQIKEMATIDWDMQVYRWGRLERSHIWSMFSLRYKLDIHMMMVTSRLGLLVWILGELSLLVIWVLWSSAYISCKDIILEETTKKVIAGS